MIPKRQTEKKDSGDESESIAKEGDDASSGLEGCVGKGWKEEEGEVVD